MSARRLVRAWPVVALGVSLGATSAAAPLKPASIEMWTRGDRPAAGEAKHERSRRMVLDIPAAGESERYDAQYDETRRYRGVPLRELLRRYAPPPALDLAILHFANGMAIPVPFRDEMTMKRLDPLVATGTAKRDAKEPLSRGKFPAIIKKETPADPRPIQFNGNKVVVAERWHPDVPPGRQPPFSPWVHADSLTGIELCASRPYFAQFDVGTDAPVRRGQALFRENCQFCHRVGDVGAKFGWDLLAAIRDDRYRDSAAHLYHNVAFKPRNAPELGLMMPALGFLTEEDAGYLLAWLKALEGQPMPAYQRPR